MTSFFSAEGSPIWIKLRRLVQNHMSTAMIWPKLKPEVEFQYGERLGEFNGMSSHSHLPHCRVLPPGEFTVTIREPHAKLQIECSYLAKSMSWSCHIAGCKNSIRHIENRFSPYFIYFCFLDAFWALTSGGFRIVSDTLVILSHKFAIGLYKFQCDRYNVPLSVKCNNTAQSCSW